MTPPLISVIVPVYNVQDYVAQCIESIINQSYQNLEIIIVNDGTKDNSADICRKYAEKDSRIVFLEKENGGISSARNFGLDRATGDYISFVDSDDFLYEKYFEVLLHHLADADIVFCNANFYKTDADLTFPSNESLISPQTVEFSSIELLQKINTFKKPLVIVPWGKLYKKEIWKTIRYPEGRSHEDETIVHEYIDRAKKIRFIDLPLYYYRQDVAGSETHSIDLRKVNNYYQACLNREAFFLKKGMNKEAAKIYNNGKSYLIRKSIKMKAQNENTTFSAILKDPKLFLSSKFELIVKKLIYKS
ncbi:glycosyltransferase [Myroides pelagicus]|uniref:glycosyltransferase n=1 Tax=Myroides pelagicus TaxID=270914 RepID=UPI002DB68C46|nr:glycosyltransferase [Myroides pelagicus]MEC4114115.1 glycosyltransferase [Myroides pelagicus]